MRSVGLKVLKDKLSKYVRLAAAGETVLVTDRDRIVAELCPPQPRRGSDSDANYAELIRSGHIRPATRRGEPLPVFHPTMTLEELLKDLDEARADRDLPR